MKKTWKKIFSICLLATVFCAPAANPILERFQKRQKTETESREKYLEQLNDLDKDGLLQALPLGKDTALIKKMQLKQGQALKKDYDRLNSSRGEDKREHVMVEKFRRGEVLLITIPASLIFMPNGVEMTQTASTYLKPLLRFLRNPDMYWMILDMHTDNTGSKQYSDNLALNRVDAVYDWFDGSGADTDFIFLTASGSNDPLPGTKNISMEERARNRRLEVYLVPGRKMLEQAKKGRISF